MPLEHALEASHLRKRNLRVLFLTTNAYGAGGGIALYNRDLIQALAAMPEVERVVVVPRASTMPTGPIPAKVWLRPVPSSSKSAFVLEATRAAFGRFDLLICGHINVLPLAALLNLTRSAPMVLLVYGIDVWQRPGHLAKQWLRKVDAIWSISAVTRDRMNVWADQPIDKYIVLPNAIHLERYGIRERRSDLSARLGLEGSRVIMTLGRLSASERYKGVDEVLDGMPALLTADPLLKYLVVGDGDDRPRLEAKAKALGLSGKVVFTGHVSEEEKGDFLRLADAFVMPGRGEGFGFVYLEALACGVPVVGSRVDGSREALRDGMLGELVDPTDPSSVTEGILRALERPKEIVDGIEHFAWPAFASRVAQAVVLLELSGKVSK